MVLVKATYGNYHLLTGTAAEVLQALSDERVQKNQLANIADDGTSAIYMKGNPSI